MRVSLRRGPRSHPRSHAARVPLVSSSGAVPAMLGRCIGLGAVWATLGCRSGATHAAHRTSLSQLSRVGVRPPMRLVGQRGLVAQAASGEVVEGRRPLACRDHLGIVGCALASSAADMSQMIAGRSILVCKARRSVGGGCSPQRIAAGSAAPWRRGCHVHVWFGKSRQSVVGLQSRSGGSERGGRCHHGGRRLRRSGRTSDIAACASSGLADLTPVARLRHLNNIPCLM